MHVPELFFRRKCKHVVGVELKKLELSGGEIKEYKSFSDRLNNSFGGALFNNDVIVGIYGEADIGKTLFCLENAYYIASAGHNVLYVDTEGSVLSKAKYWHKTLSEKYKTNGDIYIEVPLERYKSKNILSAFAEYLGLGISITFHSADKKGEKGKMEVAIVRRDESSDLERDVAGGKISVIFVDSIVAPIRAMIPDERQNSPAKATLLSALMGRLEEIQKKYGVAICVTAHASIDPTNQYATVADMKMRGGGTLQYFCKRILLITRREKAEYRDYRKVWIMRGDRKREFGEVYGFKIDSKGWHEVDEKKTEELLTDSEKVLLL